MSNRLLWVPFGAFAMLLAVVAHGLIRPADRTVHSAMVGQPLPTFSLGVIAPAKPGVSSAVFHQGQPRLLNLFASWCIPCVAEAPQLMKLKRAGVPIEGVAVRDTPAGLSAFLRRNGDPYERIGNDAAASLQLSLGSSGVPETFVVNGRGVIIAQHVGDIRAEDVPGILRTLEAAR